MRPVRVNVSMTGGVSSVIPLNLYAPTFNVGIGTSITGAGPNTYTVEHTFDDVFSPTFSASTATWFGTTSFSGVTTKVSGNITIPVSAVRLNVASFSGAGGITLNILQDGIQ